MKTIIYKTILCTAILAVMGCKDKTATVIDVEEQVKKIAPFIKKVQGGVK